MGHEFKHGGGQTLVDEVAGQSALMTNKHRVLIVYFFHVDIFSLPVTHFHLHHSAYSHVHVSMSPPHRLCTHTYDSQRFQMQEDAN